MRLNPVSKAEACRYMGIRGEADTQINEILDRAEELVRATLCPKYTYRETSLYYYGDELFAEGMSTPLKGSDIKEHLKGCTRAVIIASTLSSEADKLIRQAQIRDMTEALAVDALCSSAIEQVCDRAEEEIFRNAQGIYHTTRYSPGYGDFPIDMQKDILSFLDATRRIGLTVTDSSLLVPTKSVTAIIGVSETPVDSVATKCEKCSARQNCAYRRSGTSCS
ncbi:MAG: 5-methyltetrahydrofolate--homocysteine methyltransferase [Ruminococcus sp.]|nr:5-methyltetrahydrofolate--homocysteine methyltransferase [Ruminococcus sp.]